MATNKSAFSTHFSKLLTFYVTLWCFEKTGPVSTFSSYPFSKHHETIQDNRKYLVATDCCCMKYLLYAWRRLKPNCAATWMCILAETVVYVKSSKRLHAFLSGLILKLPILRSVFSIF